MVIHMYLDYEFALVMNVKETAIIITNLIKFIMHLKSSSYVVIYKVKVQMLNF